MRIEGLENITLIGHTVKKKQEETMDNLSYEFM